MTGSPQNPGPIPREMPTHVGSEAGDNRGRTEGLPQVQESVLEHAEEETRPDAKSLAEGLKGQFLVGQRHPDHEFLYVCSVSENGTPSWTSSLAFRRGTVRCFPLPQTRKDHPIRSSC